MKEKIKRIFLGNEYMMGSSKLIIPKTLIISITILNIFCGIASGMWLAILGEWSEIMRGIPFIVGGVLGIIFAFLPSFIFFFNPAIMLMEHGKKILGMFLGSLGVFYNFLLVSAWCIWIMWQFMSSATTDSFIPLLIWSYGVALAPLMLLFVKSNQKQGEFSLLIVLFCAQIAYIIGMIMFFLGATLGIIITIFIIIMVPSAIFQILIVFGREVKKSFTSKEIKEALEILYEIRQTSRSFDGFDLVKEPIKEYLLTHSIEYNEAIKKISPRQWIYSTVANIASDFLKSDHHYIYNIHPRYQDPIYPEILYPIDSVDREHLSRIYADVTEKLIKMDVMEKKALKNKS